MLSLPIVRSRFWIGRHEVLIYNIKRASGLEKVATNGRCFDAAQVEVYGCPAFARIIIFGRVGLAWRS